MLSTGDTQTKYGVHPEAACAEIPVLFPDAELAVLEQKAAADGRTIGQMIRLAIGAYLAGGCRCGADDRLDAVPDSSNVGEIRLLVPTSRLAELQALAARRGTTTDALIRRVVCHSIIGCSSRPASNES